MTIACPRPPLSRDESLRARCFAEMAALLGRDHVVVSTGAARFRVELREWFDHLDDSEVQAVLSAARGVSANIVRAAGFLPAGKILVWAAEQRVEIPESVTEGFRELVVLCPADEVAEIILHAAAQPIGAARVGEIGDLGEIGGHFDQRGAQLADIPRKTAHRSKFSKKAKGRQ